MRSLAAISVSAATLAVLIAASCAEIPPPPPIQVRELKAYHGQYGGADTEIGITFKLRNTGKIEISAGTVKFKLYQNGNPIPDYGHYEQSFDISMGLQPDEEIEVTIALDQLFYYLPPGEIQIKDFFFSSLTLSDGTSWTDTYQIYKYPYENETVTI